MGPKQMNRKRVILFWRGLFVCVYQKGKGGDGVGAGEIGAGKTAYCSECHHVLFFPPRCLFSAFGPPSFKAPALWALLLLSGPFANVLQFQFPAKTTSSRAPRT